MANACLGVKVGCKVPNKGAVGMGQVVHGGSVVFPTLIRGADYQQVTLNQVGFGGNMRRASVVSPREAIGEGDMRGVRTPTGSDSHGVVGEDMIRIMGGGYAAGVHAALVAVLAVVS